MDDFLLGGTLNFEVDRRHVEEILAVHPDAARAVRAHRAFVGRAVRWCAARGIDQYLDLGSGFPGVGSVHEIARRVRPAARVVYVDADPVTVAHGHALVAGHPGLAVAGVDLTDPDAVLGHPAAAALLDLAEPIALVATAVLHSLSTRAASTALGGYRKVLAAGSAVVVSHAGAPGVPPEPAAGTPAAAMLDAYRSGYGTILLRGPAEVGALLDGFSVAAPGLVDAAQWPDRRVDPIGVVAGVATVP